MNARAASRPTIGLLLGARADRSLLASFLSEVGHPVLAPDTTALDRSGLDRASLIIVDEPAALECSKYLLAIKERVNPVVLPIMVALPAGADGASWLRQGFDALLRMPLAKGDLLARIETFLRLRAQSEEALRASEAFSRSALDAIPANVCVVDEQGRITLANRAWRDFAESNGAPPEAACEGSNYAAACRAAASGADAEVRNAAAAILRVVEGQEDSCAIEYPCHAPAERRWFIASAVRFRSAAAPFTVVSHTNITARRENELAALAAEQRFRSLVELSSDLYWETDREHRLVERTANEGVKADFTYPASEALGKTRWDLPSVSPDAKGWAELRAKMDAHLPFWNFEFSRIRPDGSIRHSSICGEPVFDERGGFTGYRGVGSDISERKRDETLITLEHAVTRALAEAQDTEAGLKSLIRTVCERQNWDYGRYWELDETEGVLRFGEAWSVPDPVIVRHLEQTRGIVFRPGSGLVGNVLATGKPVLEPDLSRNPQVLQEMFVHESGLRGACTFPVTFEGKTIGVLAFVGREVRRADSRQLDSMAAIGSEVGQFLKRRQAEAEIRESESRYRSLVGLAADWYWETDAQYRFTRVHMKSETQRGRNEENILGRCPWELGYQQELESKWDKLRAALDARQSVREFEVVTRDVKGEPRHILVSGHPVFDALGAFIGYRGISREVTDRRRAEKLHALEHAVARNLTDNDDPAVALEQVLRAICDTREVECGRYFEVDEAAGILRHIACWGGRGKPALQSFLDHSRGIAMRQGEGVCGRVWETGQSLWVKDIAKDVRLLDSDPILAAGLRSAFAVPVVSEGKTIGVLACFGSHMQEPDVKVLETMNAIGAQLGHYLGRARSQAELRRNEARFRSLTELSSDWYWEQDEECRFVDFSGGTAKWGPGQEDAIGKRRWEIPGTVPLSGSWEEHQAALAARRPFRDFQYSRVLGNGLPQYVSASGHPVYDEEGRFKGYRGVATDITARKREDALRELEHSTARLLALGDASGATLESVMGAICRSEGFDCGRYFEVDEEEAVIRFAGGWGGPGDAIRNFLDQSRDIRFRRGEGLAGIVWQSGEPLWVEDVARDSRAINGGLATTANVHSAFVVPVLSEGRTVGVLSFSSQRMRSPDKELLKTAQAIGSQLGQYLGRKRSEENLLRFRAALNVSGDSIYLVDIATTRLIDVNDAACRSTGYSREELLGSNPSLLFAGKTDDDMREIYRGALACQDGDSEFQTVVAQHRHKDGRLMPVEITRKVLRTYEGNYVVGIVRDIGHRIAQEAALRASNERFEIVARATNDVVWDWDVAADALWWNENYFAVFGFDRENTKPSLESWSDFIAPEDLNRVMDSVHTAMESDSGSWSAEYRFRKADGTYANVLDRCLIVRGPDGRPVRMIGAMLDITERKRGEEDLIRFRLALEASGDAILLIDRESLRYIDVNQTFCDLVGYTREEVLCMTPMDLFSADRATLERDYDALIAGRGGSAGKVEGWYRRKDGTRVAIETHRRVMRGKDGWIIVGSARDITQRIAQDQALRDGSERLAIQARRQARIASFGQFALKRRSSDELVAAAVEELADHGDIVTMFEQMGEGQLTLRLATGEAAADSVGQSAPIAPDSAALRVLVGGHSVPISEGYLAAAPEDWPWSGWMRQMRSGVFVPVTHNGHAHGMLGIFSKSTSALGEQEVSFAAAIGNMLSTALQRERAEQRLAFLAQFDSLTGLPNRSLLEDRLRQTAVQAKRKQRSAGVLFIDLDRFKLINDTLGHQAGDLMIREVANRLEQCLRPGDTVGRISGDEFVVVLADLAQADDAGTVAQKVLDALAKPFDLAGSEAYVTASIGISIHPGDGEDTESLLRNADMAMYKAKKSTRNTYRYFTSKMNERTVAKLQLATDLRRAVDRREFALHYQPKVDLLSGAITGVEALLRWRHPERGPVSPAEFIPALENSGLILLVGEWVLEESCAQIRRWQAAGLQAVPVAVNLSVKQFRRRNLDGIVQQMLDAAGVPASMIELEITESGIADDPQDAVRQLENLRKAGLSIAIDDFGTGYSSLAYLSTMPLSALKIDRSFTMKMLDDPNTTTLVQTIISLAHSLRLKVVAEGVETEEQAQLLRLLRCDEMQGYLFSKPLPPEELEKLLLRAGNAVAA